MSIDAADRWGKWLAIGGTLLAVVAIVLGLRIMGSPMTQRLVRIDEKRIEDLDRIDDAARRYAKDNKALPATLDALGRQPGQDLRLHDPETQAPYAYERIDADSFRLCAFFATNTAQQPPEDYPANGPQWKHGAGRQCFAFHLDKKAG